MRLGNPIAIYLQTCNMVEIIVKSKVTYVFKYNLLISSKTDK